MSRYVKTTVREIKIEMVFGRISEALDFVWGGRGGGAIQILFNMLLVFIQLAAISV